MLESRNKTESRIVELDGLRGVAIIMVFLFHYLNNQLLDTPIFTGKLLAKITSFGWVGVDLFFVLSGFLISSILLVNKQSKKYFPVFYIRRMARIIPNYFLFLLFYLVFRAIIGSHSNQFLYSENSIPLWSYFLMLHNIFMGLNNTLGNAALSITWSIGIEEQFYIIFPVIIYFTNDRYLPYLLVLPIVSASIIRFQFDHWIPAYVLLPSRMDGLAFGGLVAWWYQNRFSQFSIIKRRIPIYLIMLIIVGLCAILYFIYSDLGPVKHSLFALFFALLLVVALSFKDSWIAIILRWKSLMWIGTLSYSLYLFHYFILGLAHSAFGNSWIGIRSWTDVGITILALLITVLISWLVYQNVEKPMVRWGRKFIY